MFLGLDVHTWGEIRDWLILLADAAIVYILIVEYYFDKKIYESKRRSIKRTKNKVVITVENGQASITEQPKDIEVVIDTKSS